MRATMIVVLLITSMSAAMADNLGDSIVAAIKTVAIEKAGQAVEDRLNRREEVQPARAGQNLGRVIINRGDGGGWYDDGLLIKWTENALRDVGFESLSRQGRDLVRREMEENRAPEFNPATTQSLGQLNGTEYFAVVSVREGNGRSRRVSVSEGRVSVETDTESVWAAVTLQVIDATGAVLASVDVEACDSATSLDFSVGWWRGIKYRGNQPARRDRAVMAACVKAANAVGQQMAELRRGWRFDPLTGRMLSQPTRPSGWRFDPFTGRPLDQPTAGTPRPARGEIGPVTGATEFDPSPY